MSLSAPEPLLSVLMPCYQHERFIRQAVSSVLEQRTEFPIELIASDDASSDRSGELLATLAAAHQNRMRVFRQTRNLGAAANIAFLFSQARGRYIALLEGDDYWIFKEKLAHQVSLLEAQPIIPASTHCAQIVDELGATIGETPAAAARRPSIDFQHAVTHHPMPTASLVFRRELMPTPPAWATGLYMLDWPFMAELASRGNIQVFSETWSAYRSHSSGMWTSAPHGLRLRAELGFYNKIWHQFPVARSTVLLEKRKTVFFELFRLADRTNDRAQARFWLWCYFCSKPAPWRLPRHQVRAIARSMIGWPRIGA